MMTIEERVAALERALASMDRAWAMMEKRTSDMICAAIEDRCGDAARRRDDRLAALEREDSARKGLEHEHDERLHALEQLGEHLGGRVVEMERTLEAHAVILSQYRSSALGRDPRATAPLPATQVVIDTAPRHPAGFDVQPVHMLGGQDDRGLRLSQIESELSALALRRGALVGELERIRNAPLPGTV